MIAVSATMSSSNRASRRLTVLGAGLRLTTASGAERWRRHLLRRRGDTVTAVFVSDLRHFLDLPDDSPGPARKMAEHLTLIVRAATAGEAGVRWASALPCPRRPGRRTCPGHIEVSRTDVPPWIQWRCPSCGDEGVISGWEQSPFDLRLRRPYSERGEVLPCRGQRGRGRHAARPHVARHDERTARVPARPARPASCSPAVWTSSMS